MRTGRITNDANLLANHASRTVNDCSALLNAALQRDSQILHSNVNQPLRRQLRIGSPRVTDTGRRFITGRRNHAVIMITIHLDRLRLPSDDRRIEVAHPFGVGNR